MGNKYKATLFALLMAAAALVRADDLRVRALAEVERVITDGDHQARRLVPAGRVAAGDHVMFTLEVRNVGATALDAPEFAYAIPQHMTYVADSAVGPGVKVTYSIGGRDFDTAENLTVAADGGSRPATAADYTHIRWRMRGRLKSHSVAFVRFRTIAQ